MRAYVLREVMLYRRKCLIGGHVLVECMSSGWHILQFLHFTERHVLLEDKYYLNVCLIGGHPCRSRCLTGVHALHERISYRMICLTGGHILHEDDK